MDKFWNQVLTEIESINQDNDPIIAPGGFKDSSLNVYAETIELDQIQEFSLFVIHKGEINKHSPDFLNRLANDYHVQFANEVFVIFGANSKELSSKMLRHSQSLLNRLADDYHVQFANEVFVISGANSKKLSSKMLRYSQALLHKIKNLVSHAIQHILAATSRQSIYLGNNRALTKTAFGHKIILDTRDLSLAPHILLDGVWESWITKVFLDFVRPGMSVIDIGANVGFYSLLAADRIGENGRLTCFEANPEMASLVFHNLTLNGFDGRSTVVNKAAYSHSTNLEFKISENYMGGSSLWADENRAAAYHDKLKIIDVETISLDEHFPQDQKIDLMKIDAEGAEPYILKGAKRIIENNPNIVIIMEFAPPILEVSYGSIETFYQEIADFGLNIYRINTDSTLSLLSLEDAKKISGTDVVLKR